MKIAYRPNEKFRDASLALIAQTEAIVEEYQAAGYHLTLRQIYYQLVSANIIPNADKHYKNLSSLLNKARWAGLLSWNAIEDRNRTRHNPYIQSDVDDALSGISQNYSLHYWRDQDYYLEIWVEKDALGNVISRPANRWMLTHFACKGYVSASEMFAASQKIKRIEQRGKRCIILHLGDHDPSGLDMTRDIQDRLNEMGAGVEVRRIALNMDQIRQYNPPPNPAKLSDKRAPKYVEQYGEHSWELDALKPQVIDDLIDATVREYVDIDAYNAVVDEERSNSEPLEWIEQNVYSVIDWARHQMENE